jgi:protein tyrosine kinase modulator
LNFQRPNLPIVISDNAPASVITSADDEISSPGLSLAQVICILHAYRKRSALILLALVFAFGLLIKILPKSYVATATLIVNYGDRNPLASPDLPNGWQSTFIPTQIDLIQSPVVLQPVIDRLHLTTDRQFTRGFVGPPSALRELVLSNLRNSLAVYQGNGSQLLYIQASSKYPYEAAAVANAVATEYLQLSQRRLDEPAIRRAQLYSQELAELRTNTIEAQNRVAAYRQRHGMIDLSPGNGDDAEATLTDLEQKLLAAENAERNVQAQLQAQAWSGAPSADRSASPLITQLNEQEVDLAKLRQTLGPRHPTVLALETQIAATKRALSADLSMQLADASKLVNNYQAAVATQRELVLKRRRVQDDGTKLLLELQSAEATYKRALDGYSQIEFASNGTFNDVSLVSRAAPPVRAVKPNKIKYFLASCILSFGVALGLPFAYELLLNRRLRCRDDLERHFGIPVLAQFGPISGRGGR